MLNGKHPSATAERALDIALDSSCRSRTQRLYLCRARHGGNVVRHAFGDHVGDRSAEGTAARRRQRSGVPHSAVDRSHRRRSGRLHQGHAGAEEEGARLRASGVHTRRIRERRICGVMSRDLGNSSGQAKWFDISQKIEEFVKADKKLNANVDFYSASTYHTLGIDVDLFTPCSPCRASAGWTAHVHGTTGRQSPDPAARGVYRTDVSAGIHFARAAGYVSNCTREPVSERCGLCFEAQCPTIRGFCGNPVK